MKKLLLTILIVIMGFSIFAQEVQFPSAILSAGGNYDDGSFTRLSRWRIGQIHVITLPEKVSTKVNDETHDLSKQNWIVSVYPNPVEDFLYLEFKLPETKEFLLKITDVAGRVVFTQEARPFINGSIVELNMSGYSPALYLLQISSHDKKSQQVYRIQKIN
jgi:hypothetical protein